MDSYLLYWKANAGFTEKDFRFYEKWKSGNPRKQIRWRSKKMDLFKKRVEVGDWIKIKKSKIPQMIGRKYMVQKITKESFFRNKYHIDTNFCFMRGDFNITPSPFYIPLSLRRFIRRFI